jgi:hypothetical protein
MRTPILAARTAQDIRLQVDKILRGLGNPDPPLNLRLARELLALDRAFYSTIEDGAARETVSRIVVAGRQVLQRPGLLIDAIRKLSLRALYLPDQRRILIDADQPRLKHRWNEAHEIGHSIIPWHQGLMGDDRLTLRPTCHAQLESEANYAAGCLLFLGPQFVNEARSLRPGFEAVSRLAERYGNTLTSTLWRYVTECFPDLPAVAVISGHPHPSRRSGDFDASRPCKHLILSPRFARDFAGVTERSLFSQIVGYCGSQRKGMIGSSEIVLENETGEAHVFLFETFFNSYEALTVGIHLRKERKLTPESPRVLRRLN